MNNTIIYLIGHYGVGKLTIAKAICAATSARLFDNHLANNVVFSLIPTDGRTKLPARVWDLIGVIREQAFLAIEELSSPKDSFVLTNCLVEGDPRDRDAYERVVDLAQRRGAVFVPVLLSASDAAHAARIPSAERGANYKQTDAAGAEQMRRTTELLRVEHPNRLDLDTTHLPSPEAARIIIAHAEHRQ